LFFLGIIWNTLRFLFRHRGLWLRLLFLPFLLQYSTFNLGDQWNAVAVIVSEHLFDYVGWEVGALSAKVEETLFGLHPFMDEAERAQYVRDYMAELSTALQLEAQIDAIFTNPAVSDPMRASAELRAQRDALREELAGKQSLVEAILEGQVATILAEQGFGTMGQLIPPISMRFTEIPNLLIVSPREQIRFDISMNLYALPVDEKAALETRIDREQNVSSLIVPLGGLALYPAMIVETSSIPFAVETFAHEWVHHYFFMFPLGLSYDFAGEARIINETTANLFGKEIARLVLQRYYPDLVPPEPNRSVQLNAPTTQPQAPVFDFGAEMNETRVTVDELLAEGRVEEAEQYMEQRRILFVSQGYGIRKINQAYFAFYGGYQVGGVPGISGQDPIGPAVQAIRAASPTIQDWIVTMRGITTRGQLLALRDRLDGCSGAWLSMSCIFGLP
jgi:hypothetical protein